LKPPYSRITALDLNKGEFAWVAPVGNNTCATISESGAQSMDLPNTGGINLHATLLVTKTLLIAGEGWGGAHTIRAYDKKTGAVLSELSIPGMMGSMPMTYRVNGKQYIAFTIGAPTQTGRGDFSGAREVSDRGMLRVPVVTPGAARAAAKPGIQPFFHLDVQRFRGSNHIAIISLVLRSALLSLSKDARVSKDGHRRDRAGVHPSRRPRKSAASSG